MEMVKGGEAIKLWPSVFKLDSVSALVITKHVLRLFCYIIVIIGSTNMCFFQKCLKKANH